MLNFLEVECMVAGHDVPQVVVQRPPWMRQAACRGEDVDAFFPERGEPTAEARAVCARCPVRQPCLEFAVTGAEVGIWGGTSGRERRRMRSEGRAS